jgi:O-antigen ligase
MTHIAGQIANVECGGGRLQSANRLTFLRFLLRYPIFLLAFGPPIFRSLAGIDATKGEIDFWSFIQVVWLAAVATRAIWRLALARSISLPAQISSILRLSFFLGVLFLASAAYSPSRSVSAAYAILYLLTFLCVAEFVIDVYREPPDWLQCLFHLRKIALLLLLLVLLTLPFFPEMTMAYLPGIGIRLSGGTVGPISLICPVIAIISAYTFAYSLESRMSSIFLFFVGVAGVLLTQSRGCELALLLTLAILGVGWAKTSKRFVYISISGFMAFILLFGAFVGVVGGERIWNTFNRGQSVEGIESASGRTDIWKFVIQYCIVHPQGMGYVAGFRMIFREYFDPRIKVDVTRIGSAHNTIMQVLADAGWLALAVYLIMMVKIVWMGWGFMKKKPYFNPASGRGFHHTLRCLLLLLILCFALWINTSDFDVPLRVAFYTQNLIVAIILGMSASMIAFSRAQRISLAEDTYQIGTTAL